MDDRPSLVLATDSPDATRRAAGAVAGLLRAGDVVALSGDLGAGKTCFVQGAAAALGITDRVTSPTFVLVRLYPDGSIPIVHTDVYRLETLRDIDDLGDEVMSPDAVTFIEWGDAVESILPDDRLDVELVLDGHGELGTEPARTLVLRGGGTWLDRWSALAASVDHWAS